jgi:hypothetical protein
MTSSGKICRKARKKQIVFLSFPGWGAKLSKICLFFIFSHTLPLSHDGSLGKKLTSSGTTIGGTID